VRPGAIPRPEAARGAEVGLVHTLQNADRARGRCYSARMHASRATIPSRRSLADGDVNLRPMASTVVRHVPVADSREGGLPGGGPRSTASSQRLAA
jgi:hypothetical protein